MLRDQKAHTSNDKDGIQMMFERNRGHFLVHSFREPLVENHTPFVFIWWSLEDAFEAEGLRLTMDVPIFVIGSPS